LDSVVIVKLDIEKPSNQNKDSLQNFRRIIRKRRAGHSGQGDGRKDGGVGGWEEGGRERGTGGRRAG